MLGFLLFIFLRKRRWGKNKTLKLKVKTAKGPTSSNRSKTETIRAPRSLMRNYSKKNTVTHPVIMPFLPKVHSTIPTSLACGHWGTELLQHGAPPRLGPSCRAGDRPSQCLQWRGCTCSAPEEGALPGHSFVWHGCFRGLPCIQAEQLWIDVPGFPSGCHFNTEDPIGKVERGRRRQPLLGATARVRRPGSARCPLSPAASAAGKGGSWGRGSEATSFRTNDWRSSQRRLQYAAQEARSQASPSSWRVTTERNEMDPAPGLVSVWTDKMIWSFKGHKEVQGLVRGPDLMGYSQQEAVLARNDVPWSSCSRDGRALQRPSVSEDWLGGAWDGRTGVLAGRGICGCQGPLLDLGVLLFLEQALKEVGDRPMRRGCTGGLATQSGARRCQGLKPPP